MELEISKIGNLMGIVSQKGKTKYFILMCFVLQACMSAFFYQNFLLKIKFLCKINVLVNIRKWANPL